MAPRGVVVALRVLTGLFFTRVLGQVLVAFLDVRFLPPMAEWYSGLLPYPILLPVQVVMLVVMAKIDTDVGRGTGAFARRSAGVGRVLRCGSYVYAASMMLRYVLTMTWHPERRWLHGTIPIVFHWVLAGYVWTLGRYHEQRVGA